MKSWFRRRRLRAEPERRGTEAGKSTRNVVGNNIMKIIDLKKVGKLVEPPETQNIKSGFVILGPGQEIGEHVTENKEELIVILEGSGEVIVEGEKSGLKCGQVAYIEKNKKHNIVNVGKIDLKYVYIVSLLTS